ncbi:hypothetical protein HPB50_003138 [Hyalomma asiaticum]|uniref:Uncharacterized protein n=1 Tax=Hyalomma asiaticum TaxID=266040 RepID=A0ACB7SJJ9_HYAAI|nr:hypothetical protein HPB50_003138 [Hyalomma asiaticum]
MTCSSPSPPHALPGWRRVEASHNSEAASPRMGKERVRRCGGCEVPDQQLTGFTSRRSHCCGGNHSPSGIPGKGCSRAKESVQRAITTTRPEEYGLQ